MYEQWEAFRPESSLKFTGGRIRFGREGDGGDDVSKWKYSGAMQAPTQPSVNGEAECDGVR